jgi:hypothetical protein
LLIHSSPEMRGRVIGVRSLVVFPLSTGNLMAGMLAQIYGAPIAVAFLSVSYTLSVLGIILLIPKMRKSE